MGIVDLDTADVTEWAGDAAIHPDDRLIFRNACRVLSNGGEAVRVVLRTGRDDTGWIPASVRIGVAATSPRILGMFEITPLSVPPRPGAVDV